MGNVIYAKYENGCSNNRSLFLKATTCVKMVVTRGGFVPLIRCLSSTLSMDCNHCIGVFVRYQDYYQFCIMCKHAYKLDDFANSAFAGLGNTCDTCYMHMFEEALINLGTVREDPVFDTDMFLSGEGIGSINV